jgi:stage V sporulation protein SpoVS
MNGYQDELSKIKVILKANPLGLTVTDIAKRININRNSVAKYLDVLNISGQVEMRAIGPAKVYYPSQRVPLSALLNYSSDHIVVYNSDLVVVQANWDSQILHEKRSSTNLWRRLPPSSAGILISYPGLGMG